MDNLNRQIKQFAIITIVLVLIWIAGMLHLANKLEVSENEIKSHIGENVIIQKDTAIIVNYSMWESSFILSNGKKVSFEFYNKQHGTAK